MAQMAYTASTNTFAALSTTNAESDFDTVGNDHRYIFINQNEAPVRLTWVANNGLEIESVVNGGSSSTASRHHHQVLDKNEVTIEGNDAIVLNIEALAVDSTAADNTITFNAAGLHTAIGLHASINVARLTSVNGATV